LLGDLAADDDEHVCGTGDGDRSFKLGKRPQPESRC
jgi:hypothetical protein